MDAGLMGCACLKWLTAYGSARTHTHYQYDDSYVSCSINISLICDAVIGDDELQLSDKWQ